MGKCWRGGLLAGLMVAAGISPALGAGRGSILEQVETVPGRFNLDSRLRYEVFDQAGGLDVDGSSHRIRYGYTTPDSGGVQAMIEGETVYAWGHGRDIHPADNAGDGTDLNQLWVSFEKETGSLRLGRQVYTLDDHRFIGHVGWRQNIQSFDAVTGVVNLTDSLLLRGFFIDAVNSVTDAHNDIEAYGLNATFSMNESTRLTAFYYSIDGRPDIAAASSNTAGIRFTGSTGAKDLKWSYALSYARQWENAGNSGPDYGLDYGSADISTVVGGITLGGGLEYLDGNGRRGFSTPLATLHKFNGFADVFLGASAAGGLVDGLEDYQLYAGYTVKAGNGIKVRVIHHWFAPASGPGDYGRELDLVASYPINDRFSVIGKYGKYSSEGGSSGIGSRDKLCFTFELNFVY